MVVIKNNFERTALAGLLHDIGKLLNRSYFYAKKGNSGNHPYLSEWFINFLFENKIIEHDEYLKEMVKKHHEGNLLYFPEDINVNGIKNNKELKKLALIVSRADNYSSSERYDEEDYKFGSNSFRTTPLNSIFEGVSLGEKEEEKKKYDFSYRLRKFNYENIFPKEKSENTQEELDNLISNFLNEIENIKAENFNTLFVNLIDCIKKYCWGIPSDTQKNICDLSLYDHLKTTSAISLASYHYHDWNKGKFSEVLINDIKNGSTENYFLLIGGEISGVQNYIYGIESTDSAAKRLRSRSFFVKLLLDVASYKIIKELKLTKANIIMSAGGKFYILAQNTDDAKEKINNIKKEINRELYTDYFGDLYLNLEYTELNGEELGLQFSKKYDEINDKLEDGKSLKFADEILKNPIIEKDLYNQNTKIKICKICGKELILEGKEECSKCLRDVEFGRLLPKMEKLAFYIKNMPSEKNCISLFGITCKIYEENENIEGSPFDVHYYTLENPERNYPMTQDYYGSYSPVNFFDEVKTFEEIASESLSGDLGILKGDIDNLGLIFSIGLKREEIILNDDEEKIKIKDTTSISRISTLSRMFDTFFSYWLPRILEKEENSFYLVYAGGDSFMIVGSWERLIFLAEKIKNEFTRFTAENKNITLTCGISITKPKDPIYFGSQLATEAKEKGKAFGKNGIVIFNRYIPWQDFRIVFSLADFIDKNYSKKESENENEKKIYTQSFLYRLLSYTEMAEKYATEGRAEYLKYISDFTYDIGRNIVPQLEKKYKNMNYSKEEMTEKIKNEDIIERLTDYFSIEAIFDEKKSYKKDFIKNYMRVVLNYVVRKNREVK